MIVAAALFFALTIQAFAVKPYRIPSESMLPTLKPGQRILVDRFSHRVGGDPGLNDVTVFYPARGVDTQQCGNAGPNRRVAGDEHDDDGSDAGGQLPAGFAGTSAQSGEHR